MAAKTTIGLGREEALVALEIQTTQQVQAVALLRTIATLANFKTHCFKGSRSRKYHSYSRTMHLL